MPREQFKAEILFLDPADVPRATEALAAVNCNYEVDPNAIDDYPTVFGMVIGETALALDELSDWLMRIVEPLGGDVVEWNYGEPWKIRD